MLVLVAGIGGLAFAQEGVQRVLELPRPHIVTPGVGAPWTTTQCWVEQRWFETLRSGPVDYCKQSLRYRPGQIDCVAFTDEVCWAVNHVTGEWQQLRNTGREVLFRCPDGPEPPTCPRHIT